ncbi:hypothetical protein N1031_06845 [Herbiconiux moechotypicola]|uniref:DNA polymerase III beta sliding clamp central domain-containing protein n=1 Tax=Herbiconiux moechotypicola TaxID=637393 RepID=A0ABP5QDK7_9MICO|nr:hypothetical protein [Herbiconiux moechotypicola]MCS5729474.1 hypothetical protein [Herbiconiux moechotypicola]
MSETLTLSTSALAAVASVAVAASKDGVTPVIQAVHLKASSGQLVAIATDRYRVARVTIIPTGEQATFTDIDALIPAKLLQDFASAVKRAKLLPIPDGVSIETDGDVVSLSCDQAGVSQKGLVAKGNYPPVARLFPADEDAFGEIGEISFRADWLADFAKLDHPAYASRNTDPDRKIPKLRFMKGASSTKPGPIYATRDFGAGGSIEYLLQPHILLR